MSETAASPTEIRRLAESRELQVTWTDGHQARYPYDYVRGFCPCAGCQGHGPEEIKYQPPSTEVEPWRIELVGNYGISIQWSDGHATGIYRFDFLREICPCPACSDSSDSSDTDAHIQPENGDEQ